MRRLRKRSLKCCTVVLVLKWKDVHQLNGTEEPQLSRKDQIKVFAVAKMQLEQDFPEKRSGIRKTASAIDELHCSCVKANEPCRFISR